MVPEQNDASRRGSQTRKQLDPDRGFVDVSDPIGSGFIVSSAAGRNMTGSLLYEEGITGKCLAMLKEATLQSARAALIVHPSTTSTITSCERRSR